MFLIENKTHLNDFYVFFINIELSVIYTPNYYDYENEF